MKLEFDRGDGGDAGGHPDLLDVFRARRAALEMRLHALAIVGARGRRRGSPSGPRRTPGRSDARVGAHGVAPSKVELECGAHLAARAVQEDALVSVGDLERRADLVGRTSPRRRAARAPRPGAAAASRSPRARARASRDRAGAPRAARSSRPARRPSARPSDGSRGGSDRRRRRPRRPRRRRRATRTARCAARARRGCGRGC